MSDPVRSWIADVLEWGRRLEKDADEIADVLYGVFRKGVKPPPPDDTGTPLGGPPR